VALKFSGMPLPPYSLALRVYPECSLPLLPRPFRLHFQRLAYISQSPFESYPEVEVWYCSPHSQFLLSPNSPTVYHKIPKYLNAKVNVLRFSTLLQCLVEDYTNVNGENAYK